LWPVSHTSRVLPDCAQRLTDGPSTEVISTFFAPRSYSSDTGVSSPFGDTRADSRA
jgi:hypothetical protein